jgi:hypothetical protein
VATERVKRVGYGIGVCEESWVRDRGLSEACLFIRKGSVHLLLLIL